MLAKVETAKMVSIVSTTNTTTDWTRATAFEPTMFNAHIASTRTTATRQALNRPGRVTTFGVTTVGCTRRILTVTAPFARPYPAL